MYITVDGPEASGKTTLIKNLSELLTSAGLRVKLTREPGSNRDGFCTGVRQLVLHTDATIDPTAEFLLFMADRLQHLNVVIPALLADSDIVISDRSLVSGIVYATAGGVPYSYQKIIAESSVIKIPDLSILTSSSVEFSSKIIDQRGADRIEKRPRSYHDSVAEEFKQIEKRDIFTGWNFYRMPEVTSVSKEKMAEIAFSLIKK